jgi:guanine nucleotide-binding protein subunit beta-2-like 1 protein
MARFPGCTKEISSCTFSNDSRQIFSSGFDKKLTLWNTKGLLKAVSNDANHLDNVSRIRYSPSAKNTYYASVGWDGKLKIWTQFFKIKISFVAHDAPINALAINTNGMYLATGGKDQLVKLWKISDMKSPKATFKTDSVVNDLAFNPEYQWVAAASNNSIAVWDVSSDDDEPIVQFKNNEVDEDKFKFSSLAWNSTGQVLYCGCSDGKIRVFNIAISGSD